MESPPTIKPISLLVEQVTGQLQVRHFPVELAAEVVAQLHFQQQHPRATLLYLKVIGERLFTRQDPLQCPLGTLAGLRHLTVSRDLDGGIINVLDQCLVELGAMNPAWCAAVVGQALRSEASWRRLGEATQQQLEKATTPVPPSVRESVKALWQQRAWQDEVVAAIAPQLLELSDVPRLPAAQLIKTVMPGMTVSEGQAEWDWLTARGVVRFEEQEGKLSIHLATKHLWAPSRAPRLAVEGREDD